MYVELCRQLGISDRVRFLGEKNKSEVAQFMREADFLVLPSFYESMPCVILEAFACGLPVLATEVGGIPEIVNVERGILVEPGNLEQLIKAVDYMLDHFRDFSSKNITSYAEQTFGYSAVAKRFDKLYQEILYE